MTDDEQEAGSIAYITARIVRLRSGNFAIFAPWTNGGGMPIIHIGTWAEIESFVPSTEELCNWHDSEAYVPMSEEAQASGKSLLTALGLAKPKVTIERRL